MVSPLHPLADTTRRRRSSQLDLQKTCSTRSGITKEQTPASPNSRHLHYPLQQTRSCNSTPVHEWQQLLGLSSVLWGNIDTFQWTKDRIKSSSLCNICVQSLRLSVDSWPFSYTYEFLDGRVYVLRPLKLYRHYTATAILHPYTPFVYDSLNKDQAFKTCPCHLSNPLSITSFINVCGIDVFICPATSRNGTVQSFTKDYYYWW